MSETSRIGVRELRQNLSVYLRRVKAGESLEVTERGHSVARLVPLEDDRDTRARLVSHGRLLPARANLTDLGPPPPTGVSRPLGEALDEVRRDRL